MKMTQQRGVPIVAEHRGIGIAARLTEAQLARVRGEIDAVFALQDHPYDLLDWLRDRHKSPESALLASALIQAAAERASEDRRGGHGIDPSYTRALAAIVGHVSDGRLYPSIFAPRPPPGEREADHGFALAEVD